MRPLIALLAALALTSGAGRPAHTEEQMSTPATPTARPGPGQPAPDFSAASTSGGELGLSSFKGKQTLVLAFFPKAFTGG